MAGDGFERYGAWVDEHLKPFYPEAHVMLIDALRAYIRANEMIREDGIRDGWLTEKQMQDGDDHIGRCRALLDEIEDFEFDPSLCGVLKTGERE